MAARGQHIAVAGMWAPRVHAVQTDALQRSPYARMRGHMTPLDKPLRRELQIGDQAYTLIIDPDGLKLVEKGKRKGVSLRWDALVNGDAALAVALNASLGDG